MRMMLFRAALCAVICAPSYGQLILQEDGGEDEGEDTLAAEVEIPPACQVRNYRFSAPRDGSLDMPFEVILTVDAGAPPAAELRLCDTDLKAILCIRSSRSCLYSFADGKPPGVGTLSVRKKRVSPPCATARQAVAELQKDLFGCSEDPKKRGKTPTPASFHFTTSKVTRAVHAMTTGLAMKSHASEAQKATPDPYFAKYQPELRALGAEVVWQKIGANTNSPIVTAIIDSGVDHGHIEFAGQLHGGISLPRCPDNKPCDGSPVDDDHGTNMAGTIAAAKNGQGIIGVAWNTKILPIKAFENGLISDIVAARAIEYAAFTANARVINASFAGFDPMPLTQGAIYSARNRALVVVPSGNSSRELVSPCSVYPACYKTLDDGTPVPNILVVMSHARDYAHAGTDYIHDEVSNWGKGIVEIAAPGTTFTTRICKTSAFCYDAPFSSSSTATAFTSGAAALVFSKNSGWSPQQVKQHILNKALDTPSLSDKLQPPLRLDLTKLLD